jgi:hypothetical protein
MSRKIDSITAERKTAIEQSGARITELENKCVELNEVTDQSKQQLSIQCRNILI